MVEIEIGVMVHQWLNRRISDTATLVTEIAALGSISGHHVLFTVETVHARNSAGSIRSQPVALRLQPESVKIAATRYL